MQTHYSNLFFCQRHFVGLWGSHSFSLSGLIRGVFPLQEFLVNIGGGQELYRSHSSHLALSMVASPLRGVGPLGDVTSSNLTYAAEGRR